MAFPTVPTAAAGRVVTRFQADAVATRTFPSLSGLTKNSGDLLIAIVVGYQSSLTANIFGTWGGGFTEIRDTGTATQHCVGIAYKISTGAETGTFTVLQAGTVTGHAGLILLSISGAHGSAAPEALAALAVATAAAADPAALTPSWGAADTLWIAVGGSGETSLTGSYTGMGLAAGPPTNYSSGVSTGESADVIGAIAAAVAFRQLNAASEDVGTWSSADLSNARNCAIVIAVRPAPIQSGAASIAGAATVTADGSVIGPAGTGAYLVVADKAVPTGGDARIAARLVALGHAVTYVSDEDAVPSLAGIGLVVIAESIVTATLGTKWRNVARPIAVMDSGPLANMDMASAISLTGSILTVDVEIPSHPAAGGYTGAVTVFTTASPVRFAASTALGAGGVGYLSAGGTTTNFGGFSYDSGTAMLLSHTAEARRIFLGWEYDVLSSVQTADADALFDAAMVWLAPVTPSAYRAAVVADSPISYWRLGEATGTVAADVMGTNPGAYVATPTLGVAGALSGDANWGVTFDGSTQYVDVPDAASLSLGDGPFTVEAWAKVATIATGNQSLVRRGTGSYSLGYSGNSGSPSNYFFMSKGGGTWIVRSNIQYFDTNWHHVVATKNGSTTLIYIDGVDRTTGDTAQTLTDPAEPLNIGRSQAGNQYLNGTIDEVAIYNTVLSPARILAHYNAGTGVVGSTQNGAASISGTGLVTAAGSVTVSAASAVAGAGTVAVAGSVILAGASVVAGAATVAPTAYVLLPGASSIAGAATVSATGSVSAAPLQGASSISGTAAVTAAGSVIIAGAASITGSASVAPAGSTRLAGASTIAGAATVSAAGSVVLSGASSITGVASTTAGATLSLSGGASIAGTATTATTGRLVFSGATSVVGAGTVAAGAVATYAGAASISGLADAYATTSPSTKNANASIAGTAAVVVTGWVSLAGASSISGIATTSAAGSVAGAVSASITGTAVISAAGSVTLPGAASIGGAATISAAGSLLIATAGASITGTAAVTVSARLVLPGASLVTGAATMTAAGSDILSAAASVTGAAAMTGNTTLTRAGMASVIGTASAIGAPGLLVGSGASILAQASAVAAAYLVRLGAASIIGTAASGGLGSLVVVATGAAMGAATLTATGSLFYAFVPELTQMLEPPGLGAIDDPGFMLEYGTTDVGVPTHLLEV